MEFFYEPLYLFFTFVGLTLALVGEGFTFVRHTLPLVGLTLALVGEGFTFVGLTLVLAQAGGWLRCCCPVAVHALKNALAR